MALLEVTNPPAVLGAKELETLKSYVSTLTVDKEKKAGTDKVEELESAVLTFRSVAKGYVESTATDDEKKVYAHWNKTITRLSNWTYGVKAVEILTTDVFPDGQLEKSYLQTEIIAPLNTNIKETLLKEHPDWFVLGKDWDHQKKDVEKSAGKIWRVKK